MEQRQDYVDFTYVLFLLWQCRYFDISINDFYEAVDTVGQPLAESIPLAFMPLQHAIGHAAMISKLLGPSSRGTRLREQLLNVESDPVWSSKKIRNHIEHIDERIDKWAQSGDSLVLHNLMPAKDIKQLGGASGSFYNFDKSTRVLLMLGDEISLPDLQKSIGVVNQAALKARQNIETRQPQLRFL